jgi:pimeloyl-ACP methyl ester carboxylesterase
MNKEVRFRIKTMLFLVLFSLLLHAPASISQVAVQQGPTPKAPHARVIVFVHGLHGSRESWRASNGAYWPDMVRTDPRFAFSDVEVAEYPTPDKNGKMSSNQLADILFTRLKQDHVWDHREVVFLAHSLGGILVEEMLLKHPAEAVQSSSSSLTEPRTKAPRSPASPPSTTKTRCSTTSATPATTPSSPSSKTTGGATTPSTASIASAPLKPKTPSPTPVSATISAPMPASSATSAQPMDATSPRPRRRFTPITCT